MSCKTKSRVLRRKVIVRGINTDGQQQHGGRDQEGAALAPGVARWHAGGTWRGSTTWWAWRCGVRIAVGSLGRFFSSGKSAMAIEQD